MSTHFGPCKFVPYDVTADTPRPCLVPGCPVVREGRTIDETRRTDDDAS